MHTRKYVAFKLVVMEVSKYDVRVDDDILVNGEWRCMGNKYFSNDPLLGLCIMGDSYDLGTRKVTVRRYVGTKRNPSLDNPQA